MSNIQLLDIKKTYDNKINVIENLSVEINEGEFFVLVGPWVWEKYLASNDCRLGNHK